MVETRTILRVLILNPDIFSFYIIANESIEIYANILFEWDPNKSLICCLSQAISKSILVSTLNNFSQPQI